jgi:hypothetical protein
MNIMKTIGRLLVSLAALAFLAAGLEFWIVPEQAAQQFGLEAIRGQGLVNVRADLGGLFIGLALLCGAGAWTKRRAGLIAASVVLAAVVVGRTVGFVVAGGAEIGVRELAIELGALLGLILLAKALGGTRPSRTSRSRSRSRAWACWRSSPGRRS